MRQLRHGALAAIALLLATHLRCLADDGHPPAAASDAAVLVEGIRVGEGKPQSCQGFFIDDFGTLVTAWHVCEAFSPAWVNLGDKGCFPIDTVIAADESSDVIV